METPAETTQFSITSMRQTSNKLISEFMIKFTNTAVHTRPCHSCYMRTDLYWFINDPLNNPRLSVSPISLFFFLTLRFDGIIVPKMWIRSRRAFCSFLSAVGPRCDASPVYKYRCCLSWHQRKAGIVRAQANVLQTNFRHCLAVQFLSRPFKQPSIQYCIFINMFKRLF